MKAALLALGPIAATVVVAIWLAATAADATERSGSRLDSEISVRASHCADDGGRAAEALPSGVPPAPAFRDEAAQSTQGESAGALTATSPEQEHVEVATSPISFAESDAFFSGREPATSEIAPAFSPWIPVPGPALTSSGSATQEEDPSVPPNGSATVSIEVPPLASASNAGPVSVRDIRAARGRAFTVPLDDYG